MTGGRYVISAVSAPVAASVVGRSVAIGLARRALERAMGSPPALVVIAVPAGMEDDVCDLLRPLLEQHTHAQEAA